MEPPHPADPRPRAVTLSDLSRELGLSRAAISRALHNDPRISAATRQRVADLAARLGYQPNPMASGLAQFKRDSKTIPVQAALAWLNFWPEPKKMRAFAEFDRYWTGASATAEKHGYRLEEFVCDDTLTLTRLEQILLTRGISGIVFPPFGRPAIDWTHFGFDHFSMVMLSRNRTLPVHIIAPDQLWNSTLAFDKVREHGYRRIGFIGAPRREMAFVPGYLWAQYNEVPPPQRIPPLLFPTADAPAHQAGLEHWLRKHKPDAIITEAPSLPDMLARAGHRVPDDIALAALTILDCPIDAGIYQNAEEIGRVAILTLISLIHDHDRGLPPIPREILVKGAWTNGTTLPVKK